MFRTPNWGKKVVDIFHNTPNIGLLGVAGSTYKSIMPSSWSPPFDYEESTWRINILQGFKNKPSTEKLDFHNPKNELLSPVASIDGVWMCSAKKIILKHPFDEVLLTGFHGYDVDISINISQHYKIFVTYEVLLKHLSEGDFNSSWLKEIVKVHKKWSSKLPVSLEESANELMLVIEEQKVFKHFLRETLPKANLPLSLIISYVNRLLLLKKMGFRAYTKCTKRLLKWRILTLISQLKRRKWGIYTI